jgi:hypothetical protein
MGKLTRRDIIANKKQAQLSVILDEINGFEQKRATAVMQNPAFMDWVREFRRKFIVQGFLNPVYTVGGRFSIADARVAKFGDYILPSQMYGKVFQEGPKAWIRAEDIWFWLYLTAGQEIIVSDTAIPEQYQIPGIPAGLVWREIVAITQQLDLFGGAGGGILFAAQDLNQDYLAQDRTASGRDANEEGASESYILPGVPPWINKFHLYDQGYPNLLIEVRPPWFHVAKHAIYDIPIKNLPVFSCLLNDKGQADVMGFLSSDLSGKAREQIVGDLLKIPENIKKHIEAFSIKKEQKDMTWWLWHEVGHRKGEKPLTSGQIAVITGVPSSSIKSSISRFNGRLKERDSILLGRLLKLAISMGLGADQTYRVLNKKGLVPSRDREIDGFDDLNKLI